VTTLAVIAKAPVAGRVKTRLCPPCTPRQAADLARASLQDVLAAMAACPARRRVVVLDGEPPDWIPRGFAVVVQHGDGLAQRLSNAFGDLGGPALIVGMDTPQLTSLDLQRALGALAQSDAVLGPAFDGGYWCIGLRRPDRRVFDGVPMSSPATARRQRERLESLGMSVAGLQRLRDVDTFDDALRVAAMAPASRFARQLALLDELEAA
jgi:rSAM/selenodomain-associated transferase 1